MEIDPSAMMIDTKWGRGRFDASSLEFSDSINHTIPEVPKSKSLSRQVQIFLQIVHDSFVVTGSVEVYLR